MPLILGTNSIKDTGFNVANSLRFNRGSSDYLNRTLGTPTNVDKATFSTWIKFSDVTSSNDTAIFAATADGNNTTHLEKLGSQVFRLNMREGSSYIGVLTTNRVFRDPSAWYHIVLAFDTTQGTGANRVKLYINGVQETSFSTATYPTQNIDLRFNTSGQVFNIGNRGDTGNHPDAYFAETVFIDGQQLDATSFGEFDSDTPSVWKPIDVSGLTFGNNGFYLDYEDSGNLGNDKSGGTDLTVNNLAAIDQTTDTCVNNFATMNPLHFGTTIATGYSNLTEGNCLFTSTQDGSPYPYYFSTMAVSKGKWYAEFKRVSSTVMIGIASGIPDSFLGGTGSAKGYAMYENGQTFTSGSGSGYGDALDNNDIIGVAMDLDNNKLYFSNQGVWQNSGDPESGATGTGALSITAPASNGTGVYHFAVGDSGGGSPVIQCNFGNPIVALSSGNADANDHGNFEYEVPSGYFALCTKNIAEFG